MRFCFFELKSLCNPYLKAEPNHNEARLPDVNPRGSVGYIDVSSSEMDDWEYTNIGFTAFDDGGNKSSLLPDDVYIPLPDSIGDDEGRFSMSAEPGTLAMFDIYIYIYIAVLKLHTWKSRKIER